GTGAPETATVNKNTEDYVLNTDTTPTHEPVDGRDVEFKGWSADEAVTNQVYEKDNVPATVTTIDIAEENVTVYAVWVYGDPVDPVDPPEPPTWDHSKDKTATELDNNFNSRVTLSLPSAEKELVSDVVFVLDKSSCEEDVTTEALAMLADLGASVKGTGASIKVGAVQFAGRAVVSCELTELTEEAIAEGGAIHNGLKTQATSGGTNLQAGLLEAQKMLEADTDVEDSRKYVIVITDGLTRQFLAEEEDGTLTLMAIYNGLDADGGRVWGSPSGWCVANGFVDGVYGIPGGDWNTYYAAVKANVAKDGNTYAHDYDEYGSTPEGEKIPVPYVPQGETSLTHALCLDRAIYEADKVYSELEAANYHCYAVFADDSTTNELGKAFV
ncbi:vWA domain-containing protein, partial [Anaerotignum lactatifermentans]|uniref:vWA domain-containing protein n=1 Tax=Anaerotignum lactatifermentans TaxID=160404 RepID=UPI003AF0F0B7